MHSASPANELTIVGKFEVLLWAIAPEVAIHAAVDRLTLGIESSAPVIVP